MKNDLIQILSSYVPAMIVQKLARDPAQVTEATAERIAAVVLFVDITGFTAIADRFSQADVYGAEKLATLLNDCFGKSIEIIHAHGGDVIKFAGDALIAMWSVPAHFARYGPDAQKSLSEKISQAAQGALAIQDVMQDYQSEDGTKVTLQMGIAAGDVYSVHLGGALNRWEFLLSGTPLVEMSLARQMAKPGAVVIAPEAWKLIQGRTAGKPLQQGYVEVISFSKTVPVEPLRLPSLTDSAKNSLQAYIPAAILSKVEAGHEEWLSELRRVAVLFVKLPRYGTSIKHPYMRTVPEAQAVMRAMQETLYRYAGSINKLNVDDKGITLVAAMGLPPLSHNDDAARAVRAAIEMQIELEKLDRESAIGITTGWAYCGPIGNSQRREYTMVGNTVNMAARLMQAAERNLEKTKKLSDILCDLATYQEIQEQKKAGQSLANTISFEPITLANVKGIEGPITAFRPNSNQVSLLPSSRSATSKQVFGHDSERSLLEQDLKLLIEEDISLEPRLIIVEGEAGSGKTILAEELALKAAKLGIRTLRSYGDAIDQTSQYHGWTPIFQDLFGLDTFVENLPSLRSKVLSQLPPIKGEKGYPAFAIRLSPLLNDVLPLGFGENRTTARMSPQLRQRTTRMFYLRLLQRNISAVGGTKAVPTLLLFDNGQWLDEDSWRLIIAASEQIQPLLTVVMTRHLCERVTNDRFRRVCELLGNSNHTHLYRLKSLEANEGKDLLNHTLDVDAFPDEALSIVQKKSGGNPYFAIELAKKWQETDLIRILKRQCVLQRSASELEAVEVPISVQRMIVGRIERMKPSLQLLLKLASVLGDSFTAEQLLAIMPSNMTEIELQRQLSLLGSLGFLQMDENTRHYQFQNEFSRQVCFSLLPYSQRSELGSKLTNDVSLDGSALSPGAKTDS